MLISSRVFFQITKCVVNKIQFVVKPRNKSLFHATPYLHRFNIEQRRVLCYNNINDDNETTSEPLQPDYSELEIDEEAIKNIKIILMEHSIGKELSRRVPSIISVKDMKELLTMKYTKRQSYFNYLFKTELYEKKSQIKKRKQFEHRLEEYKIQQELEGDHLHYGLGKNHIFLRIYKKSLNNFFSARLSRFVVFGQPIVYDLSFGSLMSKMETKNTAQQLKLSYTLNKHNNEPFNLHFVNVDKSGFLYEQIKLAIGNLETTSIVNLSEQSYLDVFPKEKLVYLTPDAEKDLEIYDHDAVYIIGALVDKGPTVRVTMAEAKRHGIKMAKLPLDKYLLWGMGHKSLTLNQMMTILLHMKEHNDWEKALRSGVPTRKLANVDDLQLAMQMKKNAFEDKKAKMFKFQQRNEGYPRENYRPRNPRENYNEDYPRENYRENNFRENYNDRAPRDNYRERISGENFSEENPRENYTDNNQNFVQNNYRGRNYNENYRERNLNRNNVESNSEGEDFVQNSRGNRVNYRENFQEKSYRENYRERNRRDIYNDSEDPKKMAFKIEKIFEKE